MKRSKRVLCGALAAITAVSGLGLVACSGDEQSGKATDFSPQITMKEISKADYVNKTLGGLLGQFSGFLSGYEFVWRGSDPYLGMPEDWFEFLNGPYAGNFEHFSPPTGYIPYDRLRINPETGRYEVWSDDDYHLDIFNQLILDEFGWSSYGIKEAWKKYDVSDWGGGQEAIRLIKKSDMLPPYTGSLEAGNNLSWCTEAYIENETLGMNAPGMPNIATALTDTFASNVGYFDSVIWAKFYAAMYSIAYFETDIKIVMQKASEVLPSGSYPRKMYDYAFEMFEEYPTDYRAAAQEIHNRRRPIANIDNIQVDPCVNGAFAILGWLYGNNSYMDTCKYSSLLGYDGDCTAAICTGVMGILKGFKSGNEEYQKLNEMIYYDGEGVYYNDDGSRYEGAAYPARIMSKEYPERQKIDDIVALYQKNFEKILIDNGGRIEGDKYVIPTAELIADHSKLFENYDAELRTTAGYASSGGTLSNDENDIHTGFSAIRLTNDKEGEAYHDFSGLATGKTYRLSVHVTTSQGAQVSLFARGGGNTTEVSFANVTAYTGSTRFRTKQLVFTASAPTMSVGFKFPASAASGEYVVFDDFMLEEIDRNVLGEYDGELKQASDKFVKVIKKPDGVRLGEEVILSIEYRSFSGSALVIPVNRNGNLFGSVVASNTSKNALSGFDYLEIPYIFEKDSDTVQLVFDGNKMYFGNITVYERTQYMFR